VPWLLLLVRTHAYAGFRVLGASCATVLALGWMYERATGLTNPAAAPLAWIEAHPLPLLAALVLARLWDRAGSQPTSVART
jgi:hypothetical protein